MNKNELNQKSLYELRIIGRKIGVRSASMLRKGDLIQNILAIHNGDKQPVYNNRGRKPYTRTFYSMQIDEEIILQIEKILTDAQKEILDILARNHKDLK